MLLQLKNYKTKTLNLSIIKVSLLILILSSFFSHGCGTKSKTIAQDNVVENVKVENFFTAKYFIPIKWNKNTEDDLAGYKVYYGNECRKSKDDSTWWDFIKQISSSGEIDTMTYIEIPNSLVQDTIFVAVTAIDTAGNESEFSREIATIPELYFLFKSDEDTIMNLNDLLKYETLFKKYHNMPLWWINQEIEEVNSFNADTVINVLLSDSLIQKINNNKMKQ